MQIIIANMKILTMIVFFVLCQSVSGQVDDMGFWTGAFNPAIKKLPRHFPGHNFANLLDIYVEKRKTLKDEFETRPDLSYRRTRPKADRN